MNTKHPANGVTLSFPQPGEAIVTAYGDFDGAGFARLLGDAYRVVERDTGKHPDGNLVLRDGVIEVRVAAGLRSGGCVTHPPEHNRRSQTLHDPERVGHSDL